MNLEKKFKKSLEQKWSMRFETVHPEGDVYDGVVTHIKNDFIVIREEIDFELDGIVILPKTSIKSIRDNKYDRAANEILHFNGQIKKLRAQSWLNSCQIIPDVIQYCRDNDIWPGIEVIDEKEKTILYLGPITDLYEQEFRLRCYDADGKWEKRYHITYSEIFRIIIEGRYCKNFNAFMKAKTK